MNWKALWESHGGRIAGVAFGLVLGLVYLISGFWDMLFFALVVFIGYSLGKRKDEPPAPDFQWGSVWRRLTDRWRDFR